MYFHLKDYSHIYHCEDLQVVSLRVLSLKFLLSYCNLFSQFAVEIDYNLKLRPGFLLNQICNLLKICSNKFQPNSIKSKLDTGFNSTPRM